MQILRGVLLEVGHSAVHVVPIGVNGRGEIGVPSLAHPVAGVYSRDYNSLTLDLHRIDTRTQRPPNHVMHVQRNPLEQLWQDLLSLICLVLVNNMSGLF